MKHNFLNSVAALIMLLPIQAAAQDTRENADYKLAVGLLNDGLNAQAEDQLKSFLERYPNSALSPDARFTLGQVQLKLGKHSDARSTFQEFSIRHADHAKAPDALWNLAESFAIERRHADAAAAFARLKTFYPKDRRASEALLMAGRHFEKAGDMENARLALNSITLEYPNSEHALEARYSLGRIRIEAGEFDAAVQDLTRVQNIAVQPSVKARAGIGIAEALEQLGNIEDAEKKYRDIIARYGVTDAAPEAQLRLGDLLRRQRRFEEASAAYDAAAKHQSVTAELKEAAAAGAAENAFAAGRHQDASRMYGAIIAGTSGKTPDPALYRRAATAARRAGDHAASRRYLDALIQDTLTTPDKRSLLVEAAEVSREGGNLNAAAQYYRRFLDAYPLDPGAPTAMLRIAEIHERGFGDYRRAIELYSGLLDRYGTSRVADRAQFGRARSLESLERFDEAADAYSQVLRQYASSTLAGEARARLRKLERFKSGPAADALPLIAAALSGIQEKPGGPSVDVLLGKLYLEHLKDHSSALRSFNSALTRGATGDEAAEAEYGRAIASLRTAQASESGSTAEAERQLAEFVRKQGGGGLRDLAAWELFLIRSEGKSNTDILSAAADFLAGNHAVHVPEVRLAYAEALFASGRETEAEKEAGLIAAQLGKDAAAEALYLRARVRIARREYDGAVEDLRASLKDQPAGPHAAEALYALGSTLSRTGRYEAAVQEFDALIDRFGYSPLADSAALAAVRAMTDDRKYEKAALRSAARFNSSANDPFSDPSLAHEFLYSHAVALARAGDADRAKRALNRLVTNYPEGARTGEAYYALGQIFREEGKTALAAAYLRRAGAYGGGTDARRAAAELLLEEGKNEEAAREYEKLAEALESRFEKSWALSRAVVALYRADRTADAKSKADEFRTTYPDAKSVFEEFELERGKNLFEKRDFKQAMDIFEEVADSKTRELAAAGKYWTGRTYEAQNLGQKAEKEFREVVAKHDGTPASVDAALSLGRMALRAEQWDAAAQLLKTVVDAQAVPRPAVKEAMNGLILSYEELKMYDAAVEMTRRFIDSYPGDPTIFRKKVNLGVYYYTLKYFSQAIAHFESLLGEAPAEDQAEIRYSIGEAYFYKGDFTQAALEFLKVPYLVIGKTEIDWTASAYDMAGRAYKMLEKFDLAVDMYRKIIDTPGIDPRFKAAAEREIQTLRGMNK